VPLFLEEIRTHSAREAAHRLLHVVYVLFPGLILGYLSWADLAVVDHAAGQSAPGRDVFLALLRETWKEMFDGALVSVPDMPWSYLPTLFALQLPEVLLGL